MRKFRRAAKSSVSRVEQFQDGFGLIVRHARIKLSARPRERFRFGHRFGQPGRRLLDLRAAAVKARGHGFENAAKARAAHGVVRREIRAAVKRASIGQKKSGERPAALPGNGADGSLVARVHVGPFVAVHFHRDIKLIDDGGEPRVFVALAIDDVAPMAPDRADIEKNGLVFGGRAREGFRAPFVPLDRLVHGGTQIRTCGVRQTPFGFFSHGIPFRTRAFRLREKLFYWIGCCGPVSSGSMGLRPEKPSSWR